MIFKNDFVESLKPYELMYISVDYDDKDDYKEKMKSMRWDKINKQWRITRKDYDEIYVKLV